VLTWPRSDACAPSPASHPAGRVTLLRHKASARLLPPVCPSPFSSSPQDRVGCKQEEQPPAETSGRWVQLLGSQETPQAWHPQHGDRSVWEQGWLPLGTGTAGCHVDHCQLWLKVVSQCSPLPSRGHRARRRGGRGRRGQGRPESHSRNALITCPAPAGTASSCPAPAAWSPGPKILLQLDRAHRDPGHGGGAARHRSSNPPRAPEGSVPAGRHQQAACRRAVAMGFWERAGDAAGGSGRAEAVSVPCGVSLPFSSSTAASSMSSTSSWLPAAISSLVTATKDGSRASAARPPEIRACGKGRGRSPTCARSAEVSPPADSPPSPALPCCPRRWRRPVLALVAKRCLALAFLTFNFFPLLSLF